MAKRKFKVVALTLADRDIAKADKLARLQEVSRSELIRTLIRSKRVPKPARARGILNNG